MYSMWIEYIYIINYIYYIITIVVTLCVIIIPRVGEELEEN